MWGFSAKGRAMLPVFDMNEAQGAKDLERMLSRLSGTASAASEAARTVAGIVADVRERGDAAVVEYMRRWTDARFTADRICVTEKELEAAEKGLGGELKEAIGASIENVRKYQEHILPGEVKPVEIAGAELGLRFTPVDSAGLTVPGGTAVLFSTVIMLAVPAMVAGVEAKRISVVSPPPTRKGEEAGGDISPIVLATCRMLGIEKVYRIGGAQAVAALAFGTESVEKVDMIAGPGNVFVQLAKAQVSGATGTDNGFYGPSEIVTVADESADVRRVAADLIAQAEHDPGKCFLVVWSKAVLGRIMEELERQLERRQRREPLVKALTNDSCAVVVRDAEQAMEVANRFAAEHVNLAVANPDALLEKLRHGGEVFLGDSTPVAAGDYYAGPSHCLPTGTTARFTSGVSVYTFLKRMGTVAYRGGMPGRVIEHIARLAEAEGLDGHAESVRVRGKR
jgi:histidinol dehydrogenase